MLETKQETILTPESAIFLADGRGSPSAASPSETMNNDLLDSKRSEFYRLLHQLLLRPGGTPRSIPHGYSSLLFSGRNWDGQTDHSTICQRISRPFSAHRQRRAGFRAAWAADRQSRARRP
jgi:hypothetical protein